MDGAILVTGGTGTLGGAVVRRLLMDERLVRVLSRKPRPAGDREPREWAVGDLMSGRGVDAALDGVGVIVHCATTGGRADVAATRTLVAAARRAGSPHLVYPSIVGIDRVSMVYYRAKLASEEIVERSGLPWTTLRTTQFHDLIARLALAQRWLPVVLAPSGVRCQPIDVREVAERLTALALGEPAGRVPDLGGPEVRTVDELMRIALRDQGHRRPVLPLRLPGKAFAALDEGALLTSDRAVNRGTFEEFLAR